MPLSPDVTIANNPHCFIHAGPDGPDTEDSGNDLYIATSGKCQVAYAKNGNKVEHIEGFHAETSGYNIDPEQQGAVGRAIFAKNGDIVLTADNGNIRLKAKNIYIETTGSKGDESEGNFIVNANGQLILVGGDETKIAGGTVCIRGEKDINLVSPGFIKASGDIIDGGAASTADFISSLMTANWQSIIDGMTQACK